MQTIASRLHKIAILSSLEMKKLSSDDWKFRKSPEKWTRKEILGHLIDSATNNHQRFVRAQCKDKTPISYMGDVWVNIQDYNSASVSTLIELWTSYNLHLAHVISKIPSDKNKELFSADADKPVTLEWLVKDYFKHIEHHLKQILG